MEPGLTIHKKPALILIDIQKGFDDLAYWGERNNPEAEKNTAALLKLWRARHLPIYHIQHSSLTPGSPLEAHHPGFAIKELVAPTGDEPVIVKHVNSAFIGTDLKEQLDRNGIDTVVIAGLTTDQCVSTSTRMAGNFGYATFLVYDATATFAKPGFDGTIYPAELIHRTAIASLKDEFATVITTQQVLEQLSL